MLEVGVPRARALAEALERPNQYALTLLMLSTVGIVGYTVVGAWSVLALPLQPLGQAAVALGLLLLLGLFQVVARALAVINAESSFMWVLRPLEILGWAVSPFTALVAWLAQLLLGLVGADSRTPAPVVTEE